MKKMFLVAAATVIATVSFSQVRYGFQVIGNAGSAAYKTGGLGNFKKQMEIGFGAGVSAEFPIGTTTSIRSSLNFLQKKNGMEFELPTPGMAGKIHKTTTTLNYIELPVNFVYTIPMPGAKVYFGAGPSFGYGIGGTIKYKGWEYQGEGQTVVPVETSSKAFEKDEDGSGAKRFDLSANVNAGLQFNNGLYVNAGYLAGLTNLGDSEESYKNRGILLTVGVMLGGKK